MYNICIIYVYIYMYINRLRYLRPLVLWIHHWPTHPPALRDASYGANKQATKRDVALADKLGCQVVVL